jgi:2'-5' RNA ligase
LSHSGCSWPSRFEKLRRDSVEKFINHARPGKSFGEWTAGEVHLVKSELRQTGVLHAILEMFKTKNG